MTLNNKRNAGQEEDVVLSSFKKRYSRKTVSLIAFVRDKELGEILAKKTLSTVIRYLTYEK